MKLYPNNSRHKNSFKKTIYWLTVTALLQIHFMPTAISANHIVNEVVKPTNNATISIEADSAEQNEKSGITTYKGNVKIQQAGLAIQAEKVQIITVIEANTNTRKLEKIIASGKPAIFTHQPKQSTEALEAKAENIDYLVQQGIVQLQDNASLQQQGSSVSGDYIKYFIAEQRVVAKANPKKQNTRVKTVIMPGGKTLFNVPTER